MQNDSKQPNVNRWLSPFFKPRPLICQHNDNRIERCRLWAYLTSTSYCRLIVVLVIVLFVLVIILILFRDSFQVFCCCKSLDSSEAAGLGNPAFDDHEYSNRSGALPEQRPFSNLEAMESPPSYEEAVKQELFKFSLPIQFQRANSLSDIPVNNERPTEFSEISASALACSPTQREPAASLPSTSQGAIRKRSSTTGSNGNSTMQLSTISEEDSERDEKHLTVVIDSIGVQAARLLENCDTSVNIANGNELDKQSKC